MSVTTPSPPYRIHTERLVIRCWQPTDAHLLSVAIAESLDHLHPWTPWSHQEPRTLEQRVEWLRFVRGQYDLGQAFTMGILNRDETQVLGGTGFHGVTQDALEIGYWIHAHHINQGLATESTAALTKVAFEILGVNRVEIRCDPDNVKSAAVPKKLGFTHEATLRQRAKDAQGKFRDSMIWSLFAEDYPESKPATAEIEAFDAIGRLIGL